MKLCTARKSDRFVSETIIGASKIRVIFRTINKKIDISAKLWFRRAEGIRESP
jgi:hypothetical protein